MNFVQRLENKIKRLLASCCGPHSSQDFILVVTVEEFLVPGLPQGSL